MADVMTNEKSLHPAEGPVDLTKRVTLYAPKGAPHHSEGEETQVAESQVATFEALGFSKNKPTKKA